MAVIPPWAIDAIDDGEGRLAPAYDGAALRAVFSTALAGGTTPTTARPGVVTGLNVTVSGDTVNVSPGMIVVTTPDGSFVTGLTADEARGLSARHATNPRMDRVAIEVRHTPTEREARLVLIAGVPAPSPQAPPTPVGAESLGTISVPADGGGGAVFNDERRYTAARGGIIPVPNGTARDRLTPGTAENPLYVDRADTGTIERHAGSGWEPIGSGPILLDEVSLSGTVGTGTDLVIPNALRGTFRNYEIEVSASVNGANPTKNIVVRVNGDSGSNYKSHAWGRYLDERVWFQNNSSTALPAIGAAGLSAGTIRTKYTVRTLGSTGLMMWTTEGWIDHGTGGGAPIAGGGKWSGSSSVPSRFSVRTADTSDLWGSGSIARLWGYR